MGAASQGFMGAASQGFMEAASQGFMEAASQGFMEAAIGALGVYRASWIRSDKASSYIQGQQYLVTGSQKENQQRVCR